MIEPEIRPACPEDADAMSRLMTELALSHVVAGFSPDGVERLLATLTPQAVVAGLDHGLEYLVAESGDRIVGVIGIRADAHLYHLFVADGWQRRGVARRLWDLARTRSMGRFGCRRFTVNASNNAVPVYERFGFTRQGPMRDIRGILFNPMVIDVMPDAPLD